MLQVTMIGCGAIGSGVLELLQHDADIHIAGVLVGGAGREHAQAVVERFAPGARVLQSLDASAPAPDLLVECAGHSAIEEHVLPALKRGIPCIVASVGALSEPGMVERLEQAAREGGTQIELLSGAIGGIDALAAAKVGGLDSVVYTGRKPAKAWKGTPAEALCDLDSLKAPFLIFEGNAQLAAQQYPKNANVAATLSLAGLGLQHTQVRLYADPGVTDNVHHVIARGTFGEFELTLRGKPLAANPKTSSLTVYSVVRALGNRAHALAI